MKVLLLAYECSPYRGSEWAVGWGRLVQGARVAEMHVITSQPNLLALQRAQSEGLLPPNVQCYAPPADAYLAANDPGAGMYAYNYRAYSYWQQLALKLARELHEREQFDVVHQATVNTYREPGLAWQLGVPFLWGPVGGSQNFPVSFLSLLSAKEAASEAARNLANTVSLRWLPKVRAAARASACILASNSTNQRDYRRAWRREDVGLLLETGLAEVSEPDRSRFHHRLQQHLRGERMQPLHLLWSGELQTRKALPVLLRALAQARTHAEFRLTVLGGGPMRARWEREATSLGLSDMVTFCGRLPFVDAVAAMQRADLFCFTSLRDTSGNVVLEALAAGVPVVCFNHQGAADMVSDTCGVKLPVLSPRRSVQDWAETMVRLAGDPDMLLRLSEGAIARAHSFTWRSNGDAVNAIYTSLAARAGEHHGSTAEQALRA